MMAEAIVLEVCRLAEHGKPVERKCASAILKMASIDVTLRVNSEYFRKVCGGG